jgi:YebC/PmpR family DNA-binding regulatory protein
MAGHSRWANIKHRKARQDAARGKTWSKCARAIIVAARHGGGDPEFNLTLRYAVDEAKAANMPKDTIEKAIRKGTGDLEGEAFEEVRYEGYGPSGVAIIVECLTDNVNRTASEMRALFDRNGGHLGKPGAVAFGFEPKGLLLIEATRIGEDRLLEVALEAGADDVVASGGAWEVTCPPTALHAVRDALASAGVEPDSAQLTLIPQTTVPCDASSAARVMRLIDAVEDHDDVQKVHHNAEIPEDVMARIA